MLKVENCLLMNNVRFNSVLILCEYTYHIMSSSFRVWTALDLCRFQYMNRSNVKRRIKSGTCAKASLSWRWVGPDFNRFQSVALWHAASLPLRLLTWTYHLGSFTTPLHDTRDLKKKTSTWWLAFWGPSNSSHFATDSMYNGLRAWWWVLAC